MGPTKSQDILSKLVSWGVRANKKVVSLHIFQGGVVGRASKKHGPYNRKTQHFSAIWSIWCRFDQSWSGKYFHHDHWGIWGVPLPPIWFQKFFVQEVFSSMHASCESFIKTAALLRAGFIEVENIGVWGVTLPPVRFLPIFNTSLFLGKTHVLLKLF